MTRRIMALEVNWKETAAELVAIKLQLVTLKILVVVSAVVSGTSPWLVPLF